MSKLSRAILLLATVAILGPACGGGGGKSSSSSGAPLPYINPLTPGAFTISARGGTGTAGAGGAGGVITVNNWSGSNAYLLRTGSVDTSFTVPTGTISLGANPRTVNADTTFVLGVDLAENGGTIPGDNPASVATGLHVLPGVTLTINPNAPTAGSNVATNLGFSDGILIQGTVKTGFVDGSSVTLASVSLYGTGGVVVAPGGSILTSGLSTLPGSPGGSGGTVTLQGAGAIINQGTITARGGDGDAGGAGGNVNLFSSLWGVYNTGPIDASGGRGNAGSGGAAGGIWFDASSSPGSFTGGGNFNSGALTARGGDGTTQGGNGSYIYAQDGNSDGPNVSSGVLISSGGNATVLGAGGNAGYIVWSSTGGHLRVSGSLQAVGGNGAGTGNGGAGNQIGVLARTSAAQPVISGFFLGASLRTDGGSGAVGGPAGLMYLWDTAVADSPDASPAIGAPGYVVPGDSPMVMVGYTAIDTSGGDGTANGGLGGYITMYNQAVNDPGGSPHLGSFRNEADLTTRGGAGGQLSGTGAGGAGGPVFIGDQVIDPTQYDAPDTSRVFTNTGAIDTRGGSGSTTGGVGGSFTLTDRYHVENSGSVLAGGGAGVSGAGGQGGSITLHSDGITVNTAALSTDGGPSTGAAGGSGNSLIIDGQYSTHSGALSARGGDGLTTGGNGSNIEIGSWNGITLSSLSGTIVVAGGAGGTTPGFVGIVTVDGVRIALVAGSVTY